MLYTYVCTYGADWITLLDSDPPLASTRTVSFEPGIFYPIRSDSFRSSNTKISSDNFVIKFKYFSLISSQNLI